MRHGFIVALTACLTGVGAALAQAPAVPLVAMPYTGYAPVASYDDAPVADSVFPQHYGDDGCDSRLWVNAEYLLWKIKDAPVPVPLVTSGPTLGGTGGAGVLGGLGTATVLGGGNVDFGPFSGGRLTIGAWLCDDQRFGIEANYLYLFQQTKRQSAASSGLPGSTDLGLPFFNVGTGLEDSAGLSNSANPALAPFSGTATLSLTSRLQGGEFNTLYTVTDPSCCFHLHFLAGFRYLNLTERLTLDTNSPIIGTTLNRFTHDDFEGNNNFFGGQLGIRGEYTFGRFELEATAKAALGVMNENVQINGNTTTNLFTGGGALQTFPGGFFAEPSNMGSFSQNHFAVVPEGDLKLSYRVTDHIRLAVGYSFLYASDVVRPGNQIDRNINLSQNVIFAGAPAPALVGPAAPLPRTSTTDFWAQGVNFGLEFKF